MKRTARVIVASNRAAKGVYADKTGPVIVGWLAERGYQVPDPLVVEEVQEALQRLVERVDYDGARGKVKITFDVQGVGAQAPNAGGHMDMKKMPEHSGMKM